MKKGKARRSKGRYDKLKKVQEMDKQAQKDGAEYNAGITFKKATKIVKEHEKNKYRNPPGTSQEKLKCAYHHSSYCTNLGHKNCNSLQCTMHSKSKAEREAAKQIIRKESVQRVSNTVQENRK